MLSKDEMKTIMVDTFLEIINPMMSSLSLEQCFERVIRKCGRSFCVKGLYVSVDFAMGAGNKVGCPTSRKMITVSFNKPNYVFERFTVNELKSAVIDRLKFMGAPVNHEQLSLF